MRRRRGCAPYSSPPAVGTAVAAAFLSFGALCCCCCSTLGEAVAIAAVVDAESSSSVVEPFTLTEGSSLKWIKAADTREGHAAACLRNGLDPTTSEVLLSDEVWFLLKKCDDVFVLYSMYFLALYKAVPNNSLYVQMLHRKFVCCCTAVPAVHRVTDSHHKKV